MCVCMCEIERVRQGIREIGINIAGDIWTDRQTDRDLQTGGESPTPTSKVLSSNINISTIYAPRRGTESL